MSSLGKSGGYNKRSKSRSRRKNLFACNLDISSEITPVEVSEKFNIGIQIALFIKKRRGQEGWTCKN